MNEIQWICILVVSVVTWMLCACVTEPMEPKYNDTSTDHQLIESARAVKNRHSPSMDIQQRKFPKRITVE
jgi:hypothetical protein